MDIEGVLLDVDGVLTVSWRPLPGAPEAVAALRRLGLPLLFATNTTVLTRAQLVDRMEVFEARVEEVITAPAVTAEYLRAHHPGARCYLIAKGDLSEDLAGIELGDEDADVVVISGAEEGFTYERLNHAFNLLMEGAALVTMHRNLYWRTDGGLKLDAGAFVTGLEEAAGVTAVVTGKPAPAFFEGAARALGVDARVVAMVGDDVESDVLAAQGAGLIGVLVRTGKFRARDLERASGRPDFVIDSIADLPGLIERR